MEDETVFLVGALTFDLSHDEEHGGFWGRWHCRACGKDGIEEKTCSSEEEALASARHGAELHERSHKRKKKLFKDASS